MQSAAVTASPSLSPRLVSHRETAHDRTSVIRDVQRARRQLRCLNAAYIEAENKPLVLHLIEATVEDLRTLHEALPANLREKSWVLTLERHNGWNG